MIEAIASLGGFAGLAALIGNFIQLRSVHKEVTPNHGSSMNDAVHRIEKMVDSLGHQIGEVRRDAATMHDMIGARLDEHATRLESVENSRNSTHKN